MKMSKNMYSMAHGPSRALTRDTVINSSQGIVTDKKILAVWKEGNENRIKYRTCNDKRCKTCPLAMRDQIDNNNLKLKLFCKNKNLIYMIICNECNLKYIGQTGTELNLRINNHRSSIKNFKNKNKDLKDIELFHFQEHNFNNTTLCIIDDNINALNKRLDLENIFICNFKTLFPYGLNSKLNGEGSINLDQNCIYKKFGVFNSYFNKNSNNNRKCRGKGKGNRTVLDLHSFLNNCNLEYNCNNFLRIRKFIFEQKNSKLKKFLDKHFNEISFEYESTKFLTLDLIKFKLNFEKNENLHHESIGSLQKEYCTLNYFDLTFDNLKIPNIIHKNKDSFPLNKDLTISVAYKYTKTLKNRICNYSFFGKNLDKIDDNNCYCKEEKFIKFVDKDKGHVVTGNMEIIDSVLLREIMCRGSKFRLREKTNFKIIMTSICRDLDLFISKIARKYHWPVEGFREWKFKIYQDIKNNYFTFQNKNINKGIFLNKSILREIKNLKEKFIITTIDKASNNFCIICKVFYKNLILKELNSNETYKFIVNSNRILEKRLIAFNKKLNTKTISLKFPFLFANVKFHKNPSKFRFVTCSTGCYNYLPGRHFLRYLNIILSYIKQEDNFIVNNNSIVLDFLNKNEISNIHTYDFENLYTNLPHDKLFEVCINMYDKYLMKQEIDFNEWKNLCKFNIEENYIYNGINYFRQVSGIPMGRVFSSALADIFLSYFESKIIDIDLFYIFRYVDDILMIDTENRELVINCYPKDLRLNSTNKNKKVATFLDINIEIVNNKAKLGVYDKRNDFNFNCRMLPNFDTNINQKVLRNVVYSQANRIFKICNNKKDFSKAADHFIKNLASNLYPNNCFGILEYLKTKSLEFKK